MKYNTLATQSMILKFRGCSVTLSGCALVEVLETLVRAKVYSAAHLREVRRERRDDKYWKQERADIEALSAKVWDMASKAERRRDRENKRRT